MIFKDVLKVQRLVVQENQQKADPEVNEENLKKFSGNVFYLVHRGMVLNGNINLVFGHIQHIPGMVGQKP